MKKETIEEFTKRGGVIKKATTRIAKGFKVIPGYNSSHMGTKKTTHVYWTEDDVAPVISASKEDVK